MRPPLFVVGCPRSGTTMISALLRNTRYGVPFETHFITKYYKRLDSYSPLKNQKNFNRLVSDILRERAVMQMKLTVNPIDLYVQSGADYSNLINLICNMRHKAHEHDSWGDKTPHYILDLDVLHCLFPHSKFIWLIRDGRDVALSLMAKPWGKKNIYSCAQYWKECNSDNEMKNFLQAENLLYKVRYEDLIENPRSEIAKLYEFLGERFDPESMSAVIKRVRGDNKYHWKTRLTAREIELFETVAASTLRKFGYETTYDERAAHALVKLKYNLHEAFWHAVQLLKQNTIDTVKIAYFGKEPFNE